MNPDKQPPEARRIEVYEKEGRLVLELSPAAVEALRGLSGEPQPTAEEPDEEP